MPEKLSEEWSKLIHRMGREREARIIGGWRWLERRLMHRGMAQQERQKREEECA